MHTEDADAITAFVQRHPTLAVQPGPVLQAWPDSLRVEGVWVVSRANAFTPQLFTGSTVELALREAERWLRGRPFVHGAR